MRKKASRKEKMMTRATMSTIFSVRTFFLWTEKNIFLKTALTSPHLLCRLDQAAATCMVWELRVYWRCRKLRPNSIRHI
jgi:hypothetical protein